MKMTLILIGLGLSAIGGAVVIGHLLPIQHLASRSINLRAPAGRVWTAISDFKGSVIWRDLRAVDQVEVHPGVFGWKETMRDGKAITYVTLEATPDKKLVRKISGQGLPFGGTWTFELAEGNGSTTLTITEQGEVYNPIFRFVSHFVFGHHASIDKYLAQLQKHVKET